MTASVNPDYMIISNISHIYVHKCYLLDQFFCLSYRKASYAFASSMALEGIHKCHMSFIGFEKQSRVRCGYYLAGKCQGNLKARGKDWEVKSNQILE